MVSICVPAYKKPAFVLRLLDAVLKQDYKDVEVVITDDSPNDDIKIAIAPYLSQLNVQYYRNIPALGSPGMYTVQQFQREGICWPIIYNDNLEMLKALFF